MDLECAESPYHDVAAHIDQFCVPSKPQISSTSPPSATNPSLQNLYKSPTVPSLQVKQKQRRQAANPTSLSLTRTPLPSPPAHERAPPLPSCKRPRAAGVTDVSGGVTRLAPTLASLVMRDAYTSVCPQHLCNSAVTAQMREEVVAWCSRATEDLRIAAGAVGVAVNLFDRFVMREPEVQTTVLYPLTAACLLVAAKVVEDGRAPLQAIAEQAQSDVNDVRAMETVILNVLDWRVQAVTPLETVEELASHFDKEDEVSAETQRPLRETLLLHALADYEIAWMRATSVGTACFLLAATLSDGGIVDGGTDIAAVREQRSFEFARNCGVNMEEVEQCVRSLSAEVDWLLDECDEVASECSNEQDDEYKKDNDEQEDGSLGGRTEEQIGEGTSKFALPRSVQ